MIFIGDIAGEYETLMRLVERCPKDRKILLLGDLNDRGLDSRKVIEWAIANPLVDALDSNHGDMMTDWYFKTKLYSHPLRVWLTNNGGASTLQSYGGDEFIDTDSKDYIESDEHLRDLIPPDHIAWLYERPVFAEGEGWIATHAPINPSIPWKMAIDIHRPDTLGIPFGESVIWNVGTPRRREGQYQIHGHWSGLRLHKDQFGEFGCGIDTSNRDCLTAFLWPEKTFIQQEFVRGR